MNPSHTQVTCRMPIKLEARLNELAVYHGRSRSEEIRMAVAIHDTQATLAYLQTDDAKVELGDRLPDACRQVKSDLAELIKETYRRPPMPEPPFGAALN